MLGPLSVLLAVQQCDAKVFAEYMLRFWIRKNEEQAGQLLVCIEYICYRMCFLMLKNFDQH